MMNILVTGLVPEEVMALLKNEHKVEANLEDRPMERAGLVDSVGDKQGLLCMITDRIDAELLERAPHLKMIANFGVGYDNIDVRAATERRIPVSNTPGVLTDTTADLAFALILGCARRIVEGDGYTREGRFQFWAPFHFLGRDVSEKMLGILGLGSIGKAVARRAKGFGMQVLYHNRKRIGASEERELAVTYSDLDSLLARSDFLSLHVPLSQETRHLIGSRELGMMKRTAFLINTSRGPVVDEAALLKALREGRIAGAGLDVYENEPSLCPGLEELENAILLPHMGSATIETRTRMAYKAAENLLKGLKGEKPPDCLNWEETRFLLPGDKTSDQGEKG
jgi:glyoxylate reductase